MDNERTSESLLLRMLDPAKKQEAWEEFSNRYGRKIFRWAAKVIRDEHAAEDVAQEVARSLWKSFSGGWRYDRRKSFRKWLKTVTRNAAITAIRKLESEIAVARTDHVFQINEVEAANELDTFVDKEHEAEVFHRAEGWVKRIVAREHWHIYRLRKEGLSPNDIAVQLKTTYGKVTTVFQRVKEKVEGEARRLNGEMLNEVGEVDEE